MQTQISVVIVTHDRKQLLESAIKSIFLSSHKSIDMLEVFLLLNGEDYESEQLIKSFRNTFPGLRMHFEKSAISMTPARARNQLLNKINSEWVFFMDDDVQIPEDFFLNFLKLAKINPNVNVWGGPNLVHPDSSKNEKRNSWFLESPFISGPMANRYKISKSSLSNGGQFNLMLCNLIIRKKCISDECFLPILKTAEENEIIYKLKNIGVHMASSNSLFVWHKRRSKKAEFIRQIFFYGFGRGQIIFLNPNMEQLLFIPLFLFSFFVIFLMFSFPVLTMTLISAWGALLTFMLRNKYKFFDQHVFWMPIAIYFSYSAGLNKGFFIELLRVSLSSARRFRSHLYS
jgi:succinoglycan biosynthesis protein ExoA